MGGFISRNNSWKGPQFCTFDARAPHTLKSNFRVVLILYSRRDLEERHRDLDTKRGEEGLEVNSQDISTVLNGAGEVNGAIILDINAEIMEGLGTAEELAISDFDRLSVFVVLNELELGPDIFLATRPIPVKGNRVGGKKVKSIAVREWGTGKFCKTLRFMFTIPKSMQSSLNKWVHVPKANNGGQWNNFF